MSDRLNHRRKKPGIVYMFLQKDFVGYASRDDGDIEADAENITNCFNTLGFKVEKPLKNLTIKEIEEKLAEVYNSEDLSDYESILVFFVTHSSKNGALLCKDGIFSAEKIMKFIVETKLQDLHKILVFQASQATSIGGNNRTESDAAIFAPTLHLPPGANFFVIKSSYERVNPKDSGSFFLKVLCKHLKDTTHETSLFDVMTSVRGELKANRPELPGEPQNKLRNNILPEVASTLLTPFSLNRAAPFKSIPHYEDKGSIGRLIVFNYNYNTDNKVYAEITTREGTEKDASAIDRSFRNIGFRVEFHHDLSADEVRKTLDKGTISRDPSCQSTTKCDPKGNSSADYGKDTCTAVVILSHGIGDAFKTTTENIKITDALGRLIMKKDQKEEKEDLSGKPKIIITQMCRDRGDQCILPLEFDDTLIFHSCFLGYESNRDATHGSWFIQTLCNVIDKIPHDKHVSMTEVFQRVQQEFVNKYGDKQMPVICSTLTKNLFFKGKSFTLKARL